LTQSVRTDEYLTLALHAAQYNEQGVGGGTLVLAVLEREDGTIHWSVDISGSAEEYEVWVSTRGKVLRIITQPL
jgi:hypothetical protein